jgi:hypothetical protein
LIELLDDVTPASLEARPNEPFMMPFSSTEPSRA